MLFQNKHAHIRASIKSCSKSCFLQEFKTCPRHMFRQFTSNAYSLVCCTSGLDTCCPEKTSVS